MQQNHHPRAQRLAALVLVTLMALGAPLQVLAAPDHSSPNLRPDAVEQGKANKETPPPVDNLEDVQKAVVEIEAVGTFEDPAEGMMMAAGTGSGFIIDPEGHVVTNNHVVTGAAYFKVRVDGVEDPVNARVVGVSECADLAVIDLDGDGYPYLTWYDQPIKVGLDVYAAGFPLGDPEYTLTRGIVSKAKASGETDWASVDKVIQHDATIDHGSSGGPLVTADALVVGVNYAGDMDANQFFSISRDGAKPVIAQLLAGKNLDAIGINGQAMLDEENQFSGIWIASVASGSPADDVGMLPGDILVALEGLPLAEDGTLATYCEILRSHDATDEMAVEVLRPGTQEVLEGRLNGRELQQSYSLADEVTDTNQGQSGDDSGYTDYTTISDTQGIFSVEVPVEWNDINEGDWEFDNEKVGARLWASTDLDGFADNWGIPGLILSYSTSLPATMTEEELLDAFDLSDTCKDGGRDKLPDGELVGVYQYWEKCSDVNGAAMVVVLTPAAGRDYYAVVEVYAPTQADLDAMDHILSTFLVGGAPTVSPTLTSTDSDLFDLVDTQGLQYEYVAVSDPAVIALIPQDYADIESAAWKNSDGEVLGNTLTAAPDIQQFNETWTTPGVIVKSATGLTEELDIDEMLADDGLKENCTYDDRYEETHEIKGITYNIAYDLYEKCGGEKDSSYVVALAQTDPIDQVVFIDFVTTEKADVEALDVLLKSFYVDPSLAPAGTEGSDQSTSGSDQSAAFNPIADDSETISARVPETWSDVQSSDWDLGDGPIGVALSAAPDIQQFEDTWDTPGVFVGVSDELAAAFAPGEVLDAFDFKEDCQYGDRYDYESDNLEGVYDVWTDCGKVKGDTFVVLAANPVGADAPIIFVYMNLPTEEDAAVFSAVLDSLAVAGAVESTQAAEQQTLLDQPLAVVKVDTLNVRSGPGTNYSRVGVVKRDDALVVEGQLNNCAWLQVITPDGAAGWVSGSDKYVTLDTRCADIAEAKPPAEAPPASGSQSGGQSGGAADSNQGCYTFQNQLGAELNVTFTDSNGKGATFTVPANQE